MCVYIFLQEAFIDDFHRNFASMNLRNRVTQRSTVAKRSVNVLALTNLAIENSDKTNEAGKGRKALQKLAR